MLNAIASISNRNEAWPFVTRRDVYDQLGRPADDGRTNRALYDLARTGYLNVTAETDMSLAPEEFELTEKALVLVEGWPLAQEQAVARLLDAVKTQIAAAESPEERDQLQRVYDGLLSVPGRVLAEILTKVLTGGI